MKKQFVSLLLVLCMVTSALPMQALATEIVKQENTALEQQSYVNPFIDVSEKDWFYSAVEYANVNGIFAGISANEFSPYGTMTRAMYVSVIGRIAKADISKLGAPAFVDVSPDAYYAPYVTWALEKGITSGTGDNTFSPNALITREQMAALTMNYFESYGIHYGKGEADKTPPLGYS